MAELSKKSLGTLGGLDINQFNPLSQRRWIELFLRKATIELKRANGVTITGRIEWLGDTRCLAVVKKDPNDPSNRLNYVGIPPASIDELISFLDLYGKKATIENMRFRVVGTLGPRQFAPGKGLDKNLNPTISVEQLRKQDDILRARAGIAYTSQHISDNQRRLHSGHY